MSNSSDHTCTAGDRFDKIEAGLDKLAEATKQIITLITETRHNRKDIDDHETRIRIVERDVVRNSILSKWGERLVWMCVAGFFYYLKIHGGGG